MERSSEERIGGWSRFEKRIGVVRSGQEKWKDAERRVVERIIEERIVQ